MAFFDKFKRKPSPTHRNLPSQISVGAQRYIQVESVIVDEHVLCPSCGQLIPVERHPARIRAECACGVTLEITERFQSGAAGDLLKIVLEADTVKVEEAVNWLKSLDDISAALPGLLAALDNPSKWVQSEAGWALRHLARRIEKLGLSLDSQEATVRRALSLSIESGNNRPSIEAAAEVWAELANTARTKPQPAEKTKTIRVITKDRAGQPRPNVSVILDVQDLPEPLSGRTDSKGMVEFKFACDEVYARFNIDGRQTRTWRPGDGFTLNYTIE